MNSERFREEKIIFLVRAKELLVFVHVKEGHPETTHLSSTNNNTLHQAKLPQLELPKFNDSHTQWQSFWDKFTANVHISEWPPINKFTYLQSFLKGEALSAINGLALTEANYETARGLLQQRFGRKLREVFSHIQELLNLSVSGKTTVDFWVVYDELQMHIRGLETLNITGAEYGVILIPSCAVQASGKHSIRVGKTRQWKGQ